jgi:hypothetical protein
MLRDADAMFALDKAPGEVRYAMKMSEATFHRWRNRYGGMKAEGCARPEYRPAHKGPNLPAMMPGEMVVNRLGEPIGNRGRGSLEHDGADKAGVF